MLPSLFLRSSDFSEEGDRCKIAAITEEKVGDDRKLVAELTGDVPGKVALNATNCKRLSRMADDDDPDAWIGITAAWYCDPDVTDPAGRVVGGIRVRAVKHRRSGEDSTSSPKKRRRDTNEDDLDSEIDDLLDDDE